MKTFIMLASAAIALACGLGAVEAEQRSVEVVNAGFENPVLADGDWSYSTDQQGWGHYRNEGNQGSWNPGAIITNEYYGYGGKAPEGQNVGWTEPGEFIDGPVTSVVPAGLAQVLTERLCSGTTYRLRAVVGNAYGFDWAGYAVQLLAGGTPQLAGLGDWTWAVTNGVVLAEDSNTLAIATDVYATSTVTYTFNPVRHGHLLGEHLQIRLLCLDGGEVDFDDIRLTVSVGTIVLIK